MSKNIIKFIVYADTHIHPYKNAFTFTEQGVNSRVIEAANIQAEIIDILNYSRKETPGVTELVFLGDMFESAAKADGVSLLEGKRSLTGLVTTGHFISGNHDLIYRNGSYSLLEAVVPSAGVVYTEPEVRVIDLPNLTRGPIGIAFMPYCSKHAKETVAALRDVLDESKCNIKILFGHAGVAGAQLNSAGFLSTDDLTVEDFAGFDKVFLGHYHQHQVLGNVIYVGSPLQHTRNEIGSDKGLILVDIYDGGEGKYCIDWEFCQLDTPVFIDLSLSKLYNIDNILLNLADTPAFYATVMKDVDIPSDELAEIKKALILSGAITVDFRDTQPEVKEEVTEAKVALDLSREDILLKCLDMEFGNSCITPDEHEFLLDIGLSLVEGK